MRCAVPLSCGEGGFFFDVQRGRGGGGARCFIGMFRGGDEGARRLIGVLRGGAGMTGMGKV